MPSYAVESFLDATISRKGDAICIRFKTDTDEVVVLDLATSDLQAALLLLVGAVERAREKARAAVGGEAPAGNDERALPVSLIASAVRRDPATGDPVAKLWLSPGRLPLVVQVSGRSARQLVRKLARVIGLTIDGAA